MQSVLWAGIALILGLVVVIVEGLLGLHEQRVSHANVVLWLLITPVVAVGSMVHARKTVVGTYTYVAAMLRGLLSSALATAALLLVWLFFVGVLVPDYFQLMHEFAGAEARAQGHSDARIAQEIHVSMLIFASPSFYIVSAIVPLLAGTIASLIGATGLRKS